jgi:hypothetical protein
LPELEQFTVHKNGELLRRLLLRNSERKNRFTLFLELL